MTNLLVMLAFCAYARVLLAKQQQEQDFLFIHLHATLVLLCSSMTLVPCLCYRCTVHPGVTLLQCF